MRRSSRCLATLALPLLVAACGGNEPLLPLAPFPAAVRIYYDNSGGMADSLRTVVREEAEFGRVWGQATSRQTSPPPPPAIDFTQDMVIVAGAGRLTADDRIQIDSMRVSRDMGPDGDSNDVLNIFVSVILACEQFAIDGFPLEIVRVRRFDGPVRFLDERRQAGNCSPASLPGGP